MLADKWYNHQCLKVMFTYIKTLSLLFRKWFEFIVVLTLVTIVTIGWLKTFLGNHRENVRLSGLNFG